MHIKIESGVNGVKAISFVDGDKETFITADNNIGWRLCSDVPAMTLWDSCQVCTVEELWGALLKVAEDKEWTPA